MLWIKALHVFFVVGWFAGLFYLPRIYVNLASVDADSGAERDRLIGMARRLYRFMLPLMVGSLAFGTWLWLGYGIGLRSGWMHAKLALVVLLVGYHLSCGRLLRTFIERRNRRSHRWYRAYNEIPAIALLAIVVLVVVKPF